MARKRVKTIECWEDLTNWIETINPYKNTIVLSGWINKIELDGTTKIDKLVFNIVDVNVLKEEKKNDS